MANDGLVDQLIELVDFPEKAKHLVSNVADETLEVAGPQLKGKVLFYLQRDAPTALAIADLIIKIGEWRNLPRVTALGLQTKAIALTLSQREFEEALDLFEQSEAIYARYNEEHPIAVGQVSRIWALACLQRYDQAFAVSEITAKILTKHEDYRSLAVLNNNLAAIYGRRGQDIQALELLKKVEAAYNLLGEEGRQRRPGTLMNQAIVLRNLGRFQESIATNETALELAVELGQKAVIARSEQNLGITYFLLGHINKAQVLLLKARDSFISDNRYRDAIMAELFVSDGLLHLRRFNEVLEICQRVKETFQEAGTKFEVAQALLNEATALTGLGADDGAIEALTAARRIFEEERNEAWQIYTDLEQASVLYRQKQYEASQQLAEQNVSRLHALDLPLKEAQALLIAAQAALAQSRNNEANTLLEQAIKIVQTINVPVLSYRVHFLRGQLAQALEDSTSALAAYDLSIRELERLQDRIMVEFRADFLADKEEVYTHTVDLCLQTESPKQALTYAERAKSRALLSMLSHHVDLRIEAKSEADQELVDKIIRLRKKRDRLYRRWETGETVGSTVNWLEEQKSGQAAHQDALNNILQTEDEIRSLWHRLLVSNTEYMRDASLWQVQTELDQSLLDEDTLLAEYFTVPDGLVTFLVSSREIRAVRLPAIIKDIELLQQKLAHNFNILKKMPHLGTKLTPRAQAILRDIYSMLVAPWREIAEKYKRIVIVPHGPLHYLPFHALFDGNVYLLQRFQMSYLPGSSFLRKRQRVRNGTSRVLVMGHTHGGRLPFVPEEVGNIASALNVSYFLNEESTRERFQAEAPACNIIHIAAHGDFNPANPLFSGLYLSEGILTTLDVFNMRLSASLVTLSACQTGRNLVGGGDELFGLTRAFLTAGTASLVLTLWPVEDRSTTLLMSRLYENLLAGQSKIAALQNAQLSLIAQGSLMPDMHPYYWAPFFLIGEPGAL